MPKYISGKSRKTPQSALSADRYRYLSVGDAEPNLGDTPTIGGSPDLPVGEQYIIVSFIDRPGERFWIPNQGGIIPGSITVFDNKTRVGGLSSTTQLHFFGNGVTADGVELPQPGVAVTITIAPPGNNNSVLFKNNDDFDTDTRFTFDNGLFTAGDIITVGTGGTVITTTGIGSVGIGTTLPTQKLHLDGDFRITGTIYDSLNQPGDTKDLIVKTATGGISWAAPRSVRSGAGGTIGQIQFHNIVGLVDGADKFYYDYDNDRVGIGSTIPTQLLDVLGNSRFAGDVNFIGDNYNLLWSKSRNSLEFKDETKATFGDDRHLQISHTNTLSNQKDSDGNSIVDGDGKTSLIEDNGSGGLIFKSNGGDNPGAYQFFDQSWQPLLKLHGGDNARAVLFHSGVKRIETTGYGVTINGGLVVSGIATIHEISDLNVSGFINSTKLDDNTLGNTNTGAVKVSGGVGIRSNLTVGQTIQATDLNITGVGTIAQFDFGTGEFDNIVVTGVSTLGNVVVDTNTISTKPGTGNLTIDSDGKSSVVVKDFLLIEKNTESTKTDSGALQVDGGVGINKSVNIGLGLSVSGSGSGVDVTLASNAGVTTTGGDLYVGKDLYVGGFADATVSQSKKILVNKEDTDPKCFITFVATNPTNGTYQTLLGDGALQYNSKNNDLSVSGDLVAGRAGGSIALTVNDGQGDANVTFNHQNGIPDVSGNSGRIVVNVGDTDTQSYAEMGFELKDNVTKNEFAETLKVFAVRSTAVVPGRPAGDSGIDLGSSALRWNNVYATTFKGAFQGNADSTTKLETPRTISFSEDVVSIGKTFDGTQNVGFALTLKDTSVSSGSYGSSTKVATFTVDSKGRLTAAENKNIDFANATVDKASYADNAGIATNLKGGGAYKIPYQSAPNKTKFIANGSPGQLLQYNQSAKPSWVNPTSLTVNKASYADNAGIATNLKGGNAYNIPYQSAPNTTGFIANGSPGQLLQYNQSAKPSWVSAGDISAGIALTANNLADGQKGSIPYQSDSGTTVFLPQPNANNKILSYNNTTNAPSWIDASSVDTFITGAGFTNITGGARLTLTRNQNQPDITADLSLSGAPGPGLIPTGGIIAWSGTTIPSGWVLCDGKNNTPDLRGRFIIGAESANKTGTTTQAGPSFNTANGDLGGATYEPGDIGGSTSHQLTVDELRSHTHNIGNHTHNIGNHTHNIGNHTHNIGDHTHTSGNLATTQGGGTHNHTYLKGHFNTDHDGDGNSKPLMGQQDRVDVGGDGSHNHNIGGNTGNSNLNSTSNSNLNATGNSNLSATGNLKGNGNTGGAGGSLYHENRPPYYALCYIMKT